MGKIPEKVPSEKKKQNRRHGNIDGDSYIKNRLHDSKNSAVKAVPIPSATNGSALHCGCFRNNRKYSTYGKYLAFDCDAPPDIQTVISAASEYELLISNHLFEIWLLMHFEDVNDKISKREIYRRLSSHLHDAYSKGHKGKTREIIQNGDVEKAIDNAGILEEKYKAEGKSMFANIKDMNPFTSVHRLIEQFMVEIS